MDSIIEKKVTNGQMTFKHLGEIKNGMEDVQYSETTLERYHPEDENGRTTLKVVLQSTDDMENILMKYFPKRSTC